MDLTREPEYRTMALADAVSLGKARRALTEAQDALHAVTGPSVEGATLFALKEDIREAFRVLQDSLPEEDHAVIAAVYRAAARA